VFSKLLSNKWTSLVCVLINSTFATFAWNQGNYGWSVICFIFAFVCGYNFMIGVKEDYYDQDGQ